MNFNSNRFHESFTISKLNRQILIQTVSHSWVSLCKIFVNCKFVKKNCGRQTGRKTEWLNDHLGKLLLDLKISSYLLNGSYYPLLCAVCKTDKQVLKQIITQSNSSMISHRKPSGRQYATANIHWLCISFISSIHVLFCICW